MAAVIGEQLQSLFSAAGFEKVMLHQRMPQELHKGRFIFQHKERLHRPPTYLEAHGDKSGNRVKKYRFSQREF